MSFEVLPLTTALLPCCIPLWNDRQVYTETEFEQVLATSRCLLDDNRARGILVIESGRVRGFGMSAFVASQVVDDYLHHPSPQLGKHLLLRAARGDTGAILSRQAIGERNASGGLDLVVVAANYDRGAHDPDAVLGTMLRAFQDVHRGYRLARMVGELIGEGALDVMDAMRLSGFIIDARLERIGHTALRSATLSLTRDQAIASRNLFLSMFVYTPPCIRFTEAEQLLLRAAIDGSPNDVVSERLGLPMTAVKARWGRIQTRAFRMVPDLFGRLRDPRTADRRGNQVRHMILEYVRQHPSELTPYFAPDERMPPSGNQIRRMKSLSASAPSPVNGMPVTRPAGYSGRHERFQSRRVS